MVEGNQGKKSSIRLATKSHPAATLNHNHTVMSSDSKPEQIEMSQFSRKVDACIKAGCGRGGRMAARNAAAEDEKNKIAAEAEAEKI